MAARDDAVLAGVAMAIEFMNDSDDDGDESDDQELKLCLMNTIASTIMNDVSRIKGYYEDVVPHYTDERFRRKFRMSQITFHNIVKYIAESGEFDSEGSGGREAISVGKQVSLTLWYLGSQINIDRLADRYGITESSVIRCRNRVVDVIINNLKQRFVQWPARGQDMDKVVEKFSERNGFMGVIGALDASHIKINKPLKDAVSYINRKGFYSLNLQCVCKPDLQFTNIFVGYPGSCHDARVLKNSDLWENGIDMCNCVNHVIADGAYPLRKWLLTPFRDNGHLTQEQTKYNNYLSSNRMAIERAFGLLKGRFRRLQYLDTKQIPTAVKIIMACCVLHNICIMHHDDITDFLINDPDVDVFRAGIFPDNPAEGTIKRAAIARQLV